MWGEIQACGTSVRFRIEEGRRGLSRFRWGTVAGTTDHFGYKAVGISKSPYDFHATTPHLMGLDHEELSYHHNGRDMRLADVQGTVINEVGA